MRDEFVVARRKWTAVNRTVLILGLPGSRGATFETEFTRDATPFGACWRSVRMGRSGPNVCSEWMWDSLAVRRARSDIMVGYFAIRWQRIGNVRSLKRRRT